MKRLIAVLLALCMIFGIVGCSSGNGKLETMPTDSSGNMMNVTDTGTTIYAKNLPSPCDYNGSNIYLKSVDFYELYSDNYTYTLFVVVKFDVSELSDKDLHWLREEDMEVFSLYREDNSSLEFEHLSFRGSLLLTDTKELVYVFDSLFDESRYSFAGKNVSITCNVTQEEEYESSSGQKVDIVNSISFHINVPDKIEDIENIDSTLYSYIVKWLGDLSSFFSNIG